jgi:DNA-binding MarR family transcriptional regulator
MAGRRVSDEGVPHGGAEPTSAASQVPNVIGTGFLLSALGMHSAAQFAARIEPLGLTPPHVGLLRSIAIDPGRSQQAIADQFKMPPSRMVAFIDDLEHKGFVERRRDPGDRRVHLLHVTKAGEKVMQRLHNAGQQSEETLLGSLSGAERNKLHELLARVAADAHLTPGVHPGYRRMKPDAAPEASPDGG